MIDEFYLIRLKEYYIGYNNRSILWIFKYLINN